MNGRVSIAKIQRKSNMIYLSENKFTAKMQRLQTRNESRRRRRLLWEERTKYWPKFHAPPTSKIALWAGFLLMLEIIIFCQYLAIRNNDATPLVGVVGGIGGWMSMFFSYNKKSTVENSSGGIVFETAMLAQQNTNTSDEAVG